MVVKCANTMSPIAPSATQLSQDDRERLVVIVFANEHDTLRLVARVDDRAVVLDARKGRLLDEHMFAGCEGSQRQIEVKARRHGHDDGIDARIVDGRGVVCVTRRALKPPAVVFGLGPIATRVTAGDLRPEAFQVAAVDLGDEAAAEEGEPQRFARHQEGPFTLRNVPWVARATRNLPICQSSNLPIPKADSPPHRAIESHHAP